MSRVPLNSIVLLFLSLGCAEKHDSAGASYDRGIAFGDHKEYDKAIECYTESIRLDPKHAYCFISRGIAYSNKKEYDKAIEDFTQAIRLDPSSSDAFNDRVTMYGKEKEYDKAIADYMQAMRLDPKDGLPCSNLACLLATCPRDAVRDGKKAVEYATRACELLEWKTAHELDILAAANAETGNFMEAVKWENKAIKLGFDDKEETAKASQRLKLYEEGKPYRYEEQ